MPDEESLIRELRAGQRNVSLRCIILEMSVPTITKENREVRTLKVADGSACINLSMWDAPGRLLVPGDIVRLTKAYVAHWRGRLTLYAGKNGTVQKIDDFCMLFNENINMSEVTNIVNGTMRPPMPIKT